MILQKVKTAESKMDLKAKEIGESKAKIAKLNTQIAVSSKQVRMISKLVSEGAYSKVELLNLKSKLVELKGDRSITKESIKKISADITVLTSSKDEIIKNFNAKASQKLNEIKSKISKLQEQLVIEGSKVSKTLIKSPVDGYLNRAYINSINEVVQAGDKIAEVIPLNSSLIISTKVSPSDIAFIKKDQNTTVKITAYDYNIYGYLTGKIQEISSDVFIDDEDLSKSYYLLKIKTDQSYLEHNGKKLKIIPGMVADVDILVGKRSLFDYLFLPIVKAIDSSGHEK